MKEYAEKDIQRDLATNLHLLEPGLKCEKMEYYLKAPPYGTKGFIDILPLLVHDSVILKQISDDAIEQIITLYANAGKQVIIALDKQTSYTENTETLLNACAVLRLAPGGQELFGKSWG